MKKLAILAAAVAISLPSISFARDQIRVVGSSTVFPFATVTAETLGKTSSFKTPVIESTGTGGGMKLFCSGVGVQHPDATNASRSIKKSEAETCKKNGVTPIEVNVGFDGIVIANSKDSPTYSFTRRTLFLALAKKVPVNGKLVLNPYKTWSDVDSSLPNVKIEILGPPPTSGTRDAFLELVMEYGAESFPELKDLKKKDKKAFKGIAHTIREDGAFIEAGENDNLIVQKLVSNPNSLGVFGFSFLEENRDKVQGSIVNGKEPTFEAIADGSYPVSRPLFFYVKLEHIGTIPGLAEFTELFLSEDMSGEEGLLVDKGLIPLPEETRKENRQKVLKSLGK